MVIERGEGPPLVLIPGIQGHWEYMRPTVEALSRYFRVIAFALADGTTLDDFADQVVGALDALQVERAAVCGVSFGGVVATRFAAAHPRRTRALVLASTPAPGWRLRRRHQVYVRIPWLFGPLFLIETPWRLRAEIAAAFPDARARRAFKRAALETAITTPVSLSRVAARARLLASVDVTSDCARITAPTLVITGEPALDHVVPVDGSSEYVRLIAGATSAVLAHTGHIGAVTRPDAFAALVRDFVSGTSESDTLCSNPSPSARLATPVRG